MYLEIMRRITAVYVDNSSERTVGEIEEEAFEEAMNVIRRGGLPKLEGESAVFTWEVNDSTFSLELSVTHGHPSDPGESHAYRSSQ